MSEGPDAADVAIAVEEKEEPHGVTDGRCNWCGGLTQQKVRSLSENVNQLIKTYHNQQAATAKLFEVCLEFLEDKRTGHEWGVGFEAAKAAGIKRRERKQQLIAAIKGYIEMIEKRGTENVRNQNQ